MLRDKVYIEKYSDMLYLNFNLSNVYDLSRVRETILLYRMSYFNRF